ncbi:hypothetical protein QBC37DRAFT_93318 [Rhypophila decipiens]|uniref:Uncharacterized protein n=1 Tax=Rhypophila decipiens TaxID=261697 RepID=A0AAN6YGP7_9PEZI|nr:hypothetical protein QBC37DRAFT_93318 [Rhypophila decipiens]
MREQGGSLSEYESLGNGGSVTWYLAVAYIRGFVVLPVLLGRMKLLVFATVLGPEFWRRDDETSVAGLVGTRRNQTCSVGNKLKLPSNFLVTGAAGYSNIFLSQSVLEEIARSGEALRTQPRCGCESAFIGTCCRPDLVMPLWLRFLDRGWPRSSWNMDRTAVRTKPTAGDGDCPSSFLISASPRWGQIFLCTSGLPSLPLSPTAPFVGRSRNATPRIPRSAYTIKLERRRKARYSHSLVTYLC